MARVNVTEWAISKLFDDPYRALEINPCILADCIVRRPKAGGLYHDALDEVLFEYTARTALYE